MSQNVTEISYFHGSRCGERLGAREGGRGEGEGPVWGNKGKRRLGVEGLVEISGDRCEGRPLLVGTTAWRRGTPGAPSFGGGSVPARTLSILTIWTAA